MKFASQKNTKAIKQTLNAFYKSLKNDELLIADLSKPKETTFPYSRDLRLFQRACSVVNLLADYFVNKRNSLLKNKKTIEFLDKSPIECREITILVIFLIII